MRISIEKGDGQITDAIEKAEKFVKIVSFQFSSPRLADLLIEKAKKGTKIELTTLPADSYKKTEEREKIERMHGRMLKNGIRMHFCEWEVGDPSLTDTSLSGTQQEGGGDKWYSLHGKFLVTEKTALVMSTNFLDSEESEVYLSNDRKEAVKELEQKFEYLKKLFITGARKSGIYGLLDKKTQAEIDKTKRARIKEYPESISPIKEPSPGLLIAPFEGRARNLLYSLIDSARDFIYLSSERLYDDELVEKLLSKLHNSRITLKIIAGPPGSVRQNPSKAESQMLMLLAACAKIGVYEDVHAKLWVTDKWVMAGSANLTKMNLGFTKKNNSWRANTETLLFDNNPELIKDAKKEFEKYFSNSRQGIFSISDTGKKKSVASEYFATFGLGSSKDAKEMMARVQTQFAIRVQSKIQNLAKLAVKFARAEKEKTVKGEHVLMATVVVLLRERKRTPQEMLEELSDITTREQISAALKKLTITDFLIKEQDSYLLNTDRMISRDSDYA